MTRPYQVQPLEALVYENTLISVVSDQHLQSDHLANHRLYSFSYFLLSTLIPSVGLHLDPEARSFQLQLLVDTILTVIFFTVLSHQFSDKVVLHTRLDLVPCTLGKNSGEGIRRSGFSGCSDAFTSSTLLLLPLSLSFESLLLSSSMLSLRAEELHPSSSEASSVPKHAGSLSLTLSSACTE